MAPEARFTETKLGLLHSRDSEGVILSTFEANNIQSSSPISSPAYTRGDLGMRAFGRPPPPPPETADAVGNAGAIGSAATLFELPAKSNPREVPLRGGGGLAGGGGGGRGLIRGSIC